MWCVVLLAKGDTKNALLANTLTGVPDMKMATGVLKRATEPELIGTWKYEGMVLYLFGYKSGRANTENKHELPPPHDKELLFGDAVIIAAQGDNPTNFDTKAWAAFYEKAFGGFEDLGSEDSDDDDEEEDADAEAEVEVEVEEEVEADEEEEEELVVEEEKEIEEEEVVIRPVRVTKVKRANKKIPNWYSIPELAAEPYEV